jgi:hypothetical protein
MPLHNECLKYCIRLSRGLVPSPREWKGHEFETDANTALAFETDANAAFHTNRFETDANTVLASV